MAGDETDGNVMTTWKRELSACVRTCLCAQVRVSVRVCMCAWVRAHIMCISECGGAGTGGGTFAIISMNVHAFKYIFCVWLVNVCV